MANGSGVCSYPGDISMSGVLDALFELARKLLPMTKEQIARQHKSRVIGEMMLANPEMSREEADRIYEGVSP